MTKDEAMDWLESHGGEFQSRDGWCVSFDDQDDHWVAYRSGEEPTAHASMLDAIQRIQEEPTQ